MKKYLSLLLVLILCFGFFGCSSNENLDSSLVDELPEEQGNKEENEEKLILEENTPQFWIDLFTFDNVSIKLVNNLTIKRGDEYKCIDGKWHVKYQGSDVYEDHNGRYIFDLYLSHYSIFTYNEETSCYEAKDVDFGESGYLHEMHIYVTDGKITQIDDVASLNSSYIVTSITFSNYGSTTLE